ncbi:calcium-binding protein [Microvirga sp. RSM25]|uniref:calcium-binding protein n=1 Tax=Microvirga sp. RSM25 TaxID=3273802 RepID=UPI00384D63A8
MLSYSINTNVWSSESGNSIDYDFSKDFYFKTSGSPGTNIGFSVGGDIHAGANANINLDYTLGFGLVGNAHIEGGGTNIAYSIDPGARIQNDSLESLTASIDTQNFKINSGSLLSNGVDLSKSSIDLGLGGELYAGLRGGFSYEAGVIIRAPIFGNVIAHPRVGDSWNFNTPLVDTKGTIPLISLDGQDIEPWELDLQYAKFTAQLPEALKLQTTSLGGDGSLSVSGTTKPFATAAVDVDAALLALFGLPPNTLSGNIGFDWGVLKAGVNYNLLDAKLTGGASLGQDVTFKPGDIEVEMTSSFGETLTGKIGDKFEFKTPEGAGKFDVTAKYTLNGEVISSTYLDLGSSFDYKVLTGDVYAGVDVSVSGFGIRENWSRGFSLLDDSLGIGGGARVDLYSNSKAVEQTLTETYTLSYENFVTAASGPNLTLTPNQESIVGGEGANKITGNKLANTLYGGGGNDRMFGSAGNDTIFGEIGNDWLFGGTGKDSLTGGAGKDVFIFDKKPNKLSNIDKIMDFNVKDDSVYLENAIFKIGKGSETKPGALKSGYFYAGTKAHDGDDHLIYNKKAGVLFYDADGTGSQAQVQIATLSKNLKLTHKDFFAI